MAFETEVDDILRELLREPGALSASISSDGTPEDPGPEGRRVALGGGAELIVCTTDAAPAALESAIERAGRELRACIRRHGLNDVPEVQLMGRAPRTRRALLERVTDLLSALAAMQGATGAVLLRGAEVLATGGVIDAGQRAGLDFLRRRIDAEAAKRRGRSSHAEVVGEDVYARSFWFGAYVMVFFAGPGFAVDFVRHKSRAACRSLAVVMPHLEDDPPSPANVRPLPPRGPKRR